MLRERAGAFLRNSEYLLSVGEYDLAVVNLEQYCQLILKYKLLVRVGTYPRTRSLVEPARSLSKVEPKLSSLLEDGESFTMLTKLEDAYVGSRYLPRRYGEREVRVVMRFVRGCSGLRSRGFELYVELAEERRRLAERLREVLGDLEEGVGRLVPGARVYLFGSYARGEATAASDVDVLVVVEGEVGAGVVDAVRAALRRRFPEYPLEVHVVAGEAFGRWYRRFIDRLVEV